MEQSYGYCLDEELGESALTVKMPSVRSRTKRPRGALLQFGIEPGVYMYRIAGRLRSSGASSGGVTGEIPALYTFSSKTALPLQAIEQTSNNKLQINFNNQFSNYLDFEI